MQKYLIILFCFLNSIPSLRAQYTTCSVVVEDVESDNYRLDVKKELFFTYTSEELRPFFKTRDYLTCEAYLTYVSGGYYFLNLNFAIASPSAIEEFRGIAQGAALYIELMSGNSVRLVARESTLGQYDDSRELFIYTAQYALNASNIRRLHAGEVDAMKVIWMRGYETYEIYYLDFFKNQFDCLFENQK